MQLESNSLLSSYRAALSKLGHLVDKFCKKSGMLGLQNASRNWIALDGFIRKRKNSNYPTSVIVAGGDESSARKRRVTRWSCNPPLKMQAALQVM